MTKDKQEEDDENNKNIESTETTNPSFVNLTGSEIPVPHQGPETPKEEKRESQSISSNEPYDILSEALDEEFKKNLITGSAAKKNTKIENGATNQQVIDALENRLKLMEYLDNTKKTDINYTKKRNATRNASQKFHQLVSEKGTAMADDKPDKITLINGEPLLEFAKNGNTINFPTELGEGHKDKSFAATFPFVDENGNCMPKENSVSVGVIYQNGKISNIIQPEGLTQEKDGRSSIEINGKKYYSKITVDNAQKLKQEIKKNLTEQISKQKENLKKETTKDQNINESKEQSSEENTFSSKASKISQNIKGGVQGMMNNGAQRIRNLLSKTSKTQTTDTLSPPATPPQKGIGSGQQRQ